LEWFFVNTAMVVSCARIGVVARDKAATVATNLDLSDFLIVSSTQLIFADRLSEFRPERWARSMRISS
jgi:hypothetical protein